MSEYWQARYALQAAVLDEDCSCRYVRGAHYGSWRLAGRNPGCLIHGAG